MSQGDSQQPVKKRSAGQGGICPYKAKLVDELLGKKVDEVVKPKEKPFETPRTTGQSIYKKRT